MSDAARDYTVFIAAAYAAAFLIVLAMTLWTVLDGRTQRRLLGQLEAMGARRRSADQPPEGL